MQAFAAPAFAVAAVNLLVFARVMRSIVNMPAGPSFLAIDFLYKHRAFQVVSPKHYVFRFAFPKH